MKHSSPIFSRSFSVLSGLLLLLASPRLLRGQAPAAALTAFDTYTRNTEARLAQQHRSAQSFLANSAGITQRLHSGELILDRLTPPAGLPLDGALLHDWRGTAFVPGATPEDFLRLMRDFDAYPKHFAPQVLAAHVTSGRGDHLQAFMRIRQHHVLTVVMDTSYGVTFGQLDGQHGYSVSRSTRIAEIASPGTRNEHPLSPAEEHGFLWRLNTYWSYEQRDDGLYLQVEAVSLTRTVPRGLGWAVGPYLESIPRDSLSFTLNSARQALEHR